MLTKNDLQQIGGVVETKLMPIKKKLNVLHKDVHSFVDYFDKRLTKVEKDVKVLQQQ
ncbi:MAG TPA: hypothetical protein VEW42_02260 [Candidatus Eisenbacteria bacterium]|nr:hypothetical protein [Candidatus Eisenbacteria bacterium]